MSAPELLAAAAAIGRVQGEGELCAEVARLGISLSGAREAAVSLVGADDEPAPRCLATRSGARVDVRAIDALPAGREWHELAIADDAGVAALLHLRYDGAPEPDPPVRAVFPHMAAAFRNASTYAQLEALVEHEMRTVVAREQAIRLILDSMQEGLLVCDLEGKLVGTRSRAILEWFGSHRASETVWTYIAGADDNLALTLELGFEQLVEGVLPFEVAADQLPRRIPRDGRTFELRYRPVYEDERFTGVLLSVQDISARVSAQRAERRFRELPAILRHLVRSPPGFHDFLEETERLMGSLADSHGRELQRALHTLKGNTALYGFESFARHVHDVEERAGSNKLDAETLRALERAWRQARGRLDVFLNIEGERVRLLPEEHEAFLELLAAHDVPATVVEVARAWQHPRVGDTFERLVAVTARLAGRLGKTVDVHVEGAHVRVPSDAFRPFLSVLTHAVRNAVDHGIESPEERRAAGKPARASLWLGARREPGQFVITVRDDGRGVDWEQVAVHAARVGVDVRADPLGALCAGSTAAEVTEVSGRGIGVSALRNATEAIGGTVTVVSQAGVGTQFQFSFPCGTDSFREREEALAKRS